MATRLDGGCFRIVWLNEHGDGVADRPQRGRRADRAFDVPRGAVEAHVLRHRVEIPAAGRAALRRRKSDHLTLHLAGAAPRAHFRGKGKQPEGDEQQPDE